MIVYLSIIKNDSLSCVVCSLVSYSPSVCPPNVFFVCTYHLAQSPALSLPLSLSSSLCLSLSLYLSFSLFLTFCLPSSPTYLPPSSPLLSFFLFSYHPFFLHSFIPSPLLLLRFFFLIYLFPTPSPYTGGAEAGMVVCKIGGPAYRIGMGGGAASSR